MKLSPSRRILLSTLANRIMGIKRPHPVRVAVNGIDAAGKSYFADELAEFIQPSGRQVIRASIDGFHNPKSLRYLRGDDSPEGFYYDSFDNTKFIGVLLQPLGPGGDCQYRPQLFDHESDTEVHSPLKVAHMDAILIVDGIFLFRPELNNQWDYRVYLKVSYDVAMDRALRRDVENTGDVVEVVTRYYNRYFAGQQIYIDKCKPELVTDVIIDNNNLQNPVILMI